MSASDGHHCSACGLPLRGAICTSCGGSAAPLALADGDPAGGSAHAPDAARPELDLAHDAWQAGDAGRLVSSCLGAIGAGGVQLKKLADGATFKALLRGVALVVRTRPDGEIVIEAPVVRLPLTQYVPALRMLLELSDGDAVPVRYSVRGDLALARFVGALPELSPTLFCAAAEAIVSSASAASRLLVGALQARALSPEEHADLTPETLQRGAGARRGGALSRPPPKNMSLDSMPPLEALEPPERGPVDQGIPPVLLPPGGMAAAPAQRSKVPTPARMDPRPKMRTPAPGIGTLRQPTAATPALTPVAGVPAATAAAAQLGAPSTRPLPLQRPSAKPAPNVQRTPIERTMVSETPATTPSPAADPLGDTFIGGDSPPAATFTGPGAALCELLHGAQTLGAVLSFADQPATMCLLIRAVVYRAVLAHDREMPNAVALLFHATADATKEIYITAPGVRRGAMAIPSASPAFETMAMITARGGQVDPPDTPLTITPITTAQDAKRHLARYVAEIDQAPPDLALRHFLALGALSELLVRTKLPAPTQERLRGILAHAAKEGPKQQAVDLMMTALTRMMA